MASITMNQKVLHDDSGDSGNDVFEDGETYEVSDSLRDYFAAQGWIVGSEKVDAPVVATESEAKDIKPENSKKSVDLDIHSTVHESSVKVKDNNNG